MSGDDLKDKISPSMRRKLRLRNDSDSQSSRGGDGNSTGGRSSKSRSKEREKEREGDRHKERSKHRARETKARAKSRVKRNYSDDSDDAYDSDHSFQDTTRSPKRFVYVAMLVVIISLAAATYLESDGTERRQPYQPPLTERRESAPASDDYDRHDQVPRRGCGMPLDYGTILEFASNDDFESSANYYVGSLKCTSGALCNEAKITAASCRKISCGSNCPHGIPYECSFVSATDHEAIPSEVRCRRLDGEECPPCQLIYSVKDNSGSVLLWLLGLVAALVIVVRFVSRRNRARPARRSKKKSKGKKVRKKTAGMNGKTSKESTSNPSNTAKEKTTEVEPKPHPKHKQKHSQEEDERISLGSSRVSDVDSVEEDVERVKQKWRETRRKIQ